MFAFFSLEGTIPTDYDQATGIEKKEIDARVAGHEVCCWVCKNIFLFVFVFVGSILNESAQYPLGNQNSADYSTFYV